MYPHPDLFLEQAKLQQDEWHRQAEMDRLAREARRQSDRQRSSPLHLGPHQIGQKRDWRSEGAMVRFLRAVFPPSAVEYLASQRGDARRASERQCLDCQS